MNGNEENQTVANTSGRFFCWRDGNKVDQSKYHWSTETTIVIGWLHWSEIWVFRRQLFSRCILTYFAFVYFAYWCNISNWLNNSNQKKKSEKKVEVPICNFANQIFEEVFFNIQKGHFQNNSSECLHDEVSLLISISSQQNHQVKSFFVKGLLVKFVRLFKTEFINQFVVRLS